MRLTDQRVVAFLAQQKEPISQAEIADKLGCAEITVKRSIRRLKGIVTPIGAGNRLPYRYEINTTELPEHLQAEIAQHP
ncbi:MAG TPA: HTH domain-containing protein [Terriglobales bacterium]|nr:HTH domain-containing protein [Terriglobales bacterium]